MKNVMLLVILTILSISVPGFGQTVTASQDGSVAIADSIRHKNDDATLKGSTECVADFVKSGGSVQAAADFCLKVVKVVSDTSKRIANEAADATKASKPLVVLSRYGGGSGRCCSNNDRTNSGSTNRVAMASRAREREEEARANRAIREEESRVRAQERTEAAQDRRESILRESLARRERIADEARARATKRAEELEHAKRLREIERQPEQEKNKEEEKK